MNETKTAIRTIEYDAECPSCKGTGLYVGLAERDGCAVVCHTCKGTGCKKVKIEYRPFTQRRFRENILWVYEINPGIVVGKPFAEYGGMDAFHWSEGRPFKAGMENRKCICPAWWYQSADYERKPKWPECLSVGMFSKCNWFICKEECWAKWDAENGEKP